MKVNPIAFKAQPAFKARIEIDKPAQRIIASSQLQAAFKELEAYVKGKEEGQGSQLWDDTILMTVKGNIQRGAVGPVESLNMMVRKTSTPTSSDMKIGSGSAYSLMEQGSVLVDFGSSEEELKTGEQLIDFFKRSATNCCSIWRDFFLNR